MRVAGTNVGRERIVPNKRAVVAAEPVTRVIPGATLLGASDGGLDRPRIGVNAEVAVTQFQPLSRVTGDGSAEETA